ncbi:MAG: phosphoenolpyruvate carboxykinase, partial [Clostridia bacterium]|nr:phosphoenolpyruvate carboxykinase [Clostridia bacterium]
MALTQNKAVLSWIEQMVELTNPEQVVWIDGSEKQLNELKQEAFRTGEMIELDQEKLPGCMYHRTAVNDVARVEGRTFICTSNSAEEVGPTNNWMQSDEAYKMVEDIARGSMKGRTMYVIPYCMGPVGSPFAKVGLELTDSIYVVLNMNIMTRIGKNVMDMLGDSTDFVKGTHCKCNVDPEQRYILHFPEDNAIWSVNSAYGGN